MRHVASSEVHGQAEGHSQRRLENVGPRCLHRQRCAARAEMHAQAEMQHIEHGNSTERRYQFNISLSDRSLAAVKSAIHCCRVVVATGKLL